MNNVKFVWLLWETLCQTIRNVWPDKRNTLKKLFLLFNVGISWGAPFTIYYQYCNFLNSILDCTSPVLFCSLIRWRAHSLNDAIQRGLHTTKIEWKVVSVHLFWISKVSKRGFEPLAARWKSITLPFELFELFPKYFKCFDQTNNVFKTLQKGVFNYLGRYFKLGQIMLSVKLWC